MTLKRSANSRMEWSKSHSSTVLNDRFCCTIQINIAVFAIPSTKLFASNLQGTIGTVSQKDTFATSGNKYFAKRRIIDLDLVTMIKYKDGGICTICNDKWLPGYTSNWFYQCCGLSINNDEIQTLSARISTSGDHDDFNKATDKRFLKISYLPVSKCILSFHFIPSILATLGKDGSVCCNKLHDCIYLCQCPQRARTKMILQRQTQNQRMTIVRCCKEEEQTADQVTPFLNH
jgi:hypothetical protein